ncbi:hypothetical protein M440DRAFT_1194940 [Trichoderma longibrachiatum ATCC 18648]|uniref:Uncharacterized protein n=1 Tax=Trichoderma longibrachiatum ATCC 18648 TaxID=983965 RepID=A0A2T4CAE7_TRILO|nr:hypothetical protein M440DRAFT_1194940 [Trichoderma longibrachiatum ATCC 18648]
MKIRSLTLATASRSWIPGDATKPLSFSRPGPPATQPHNCTNRRDSNLEILFRDMSAAIIFTSGTFSLAGSWCRPPISCQLSPIDDIHQR